MNIYNKSYNLFEMKFFLEINEFNHRVSKNGVEYALLKGENIGDYYGYEQNVLAEYISASDMDFSTSYRVRIEKILNNNIKSYMK